MKVNCVRLYPFILPAISIAFDYSLLAAVFPVDDGKIAQNTTKKKMRPRWKERENKIMLNEKKNKKRIEKNECRRWVLINHFPFGTNNNIVYLSNEFKIEPSQKNSVLSQSNATTRMHHSPHPNNTEKPHSHNERDSSIYLMSLLIQHRKKNRKPTTTIIVARYHILMHTGTTCTSIHSSIHYEKDENIVSVVDGEVEKKWKNTEKWLKIRGKKKNTMCVCVRCVRPRKYLLNSW